MSIDARNNFAKGTVSLGYNAAALSIVLTTGHGARFPAVPFNATWWNATDYPNPADDPNVEIVRVTALAADTATITRAQEGTSASTKNTADKTYLLLAGPTKKIIDDIEADLALKAPLASPALTGTPTAPTAAPDTDTSQLATTAFAKAEADAAQAAAALDATSKADAAYAAAIQRANHTGSQAISTVTGLQTALDGKAATDDDRFQRATVLPYGADPTGAADSYAAIAACLSDNGMAYLPAGTYKSSTTIVLPVGGALFGDGKLVSIITAYITTNIPSVTMGRGSLLQGVGITSPYTDALPSTYTAAQWDRDSRSIHGADDCVVHDVHIEYAGHGLDLTNVSRIRVYNFSFAHIRHWTGTGSGLHINGSDTNITYTSITSSGVTITVTTPAAHGFSTGDIASITGANETAYNGDHVVLTVPSATTFTCAALVAPSATPATGSPLLRRIPYDIEVRGIHGRDSDRGLEVEDGATGALISGGTLQNIYPTSNSGEPGYVDYTFVVDAHGHDNGGAPRNVVFENLVVTNCGAGLDVQHGASLAERDRTRNITFRNIRIVSPADGLAGSKSPIHGEGDNILFENIVIEGRPTQQAQAAYIPASARNVVLRRVRFASWKEKAVVIIDGAQGTRMEDCTGLSQPLTASGAMVDNGGDNTVIGPGNDFQNIKTSGQVVLFQPTAIGGAVVSNYFSGDSSGTVPAQTVRLRGIGGLALDNTFVLDSASQRSVRIDGSVAGTNGIRNRMIGNHTFNANASAVPYEITSAGYYNEMVGNTTDNAAHTITDAGTGNIVHSNRRGTSLDYNLPALDDNTVRDATSALHGLMPKLDKAKLDTLLSAEATVASATTTDLGALASEHVSITGTTTITGFGTVAAGTRRSGRFTGALTLTHHATSLILPGAANITTAAGDRFTAISLGSGNWVVYHYTKADGTAISGSSLAPTWGTLSGTTPALAFTAAFQNRTMTLTGNTTFTGSGYAQGYEMWINITGDSSLRTLSFPGWSWREGAPTDLAANKKMTIHLKCPSATEADCVATYGVEL